MVSVVALIIWRTPWYLVLFLFLVFGLLDGLYLSSALTKVPNGAWFTLALSAILSSVFILWRFGKERQWRAEASDRISPSKLFYVRPASENVPRETLHLTHEFGAAPVSHIRGIGIFFDKSGDQRTCPTAYIHFLQKFQASPEIVVFFHMSALSVPTVVLEDRFVISRCFGSVRGDSDHAPPPLRDYFRVILRHGYKDEVLTRDIGAIIFEQLRGFVIRECSGPNIQSTELNITPVTSNANNEIESAETSSYSKKTPTPSSEDHQSLAHRLLTSLDAAYGQQVVYVVGKEQMRIRPDRGVKGIMRNIFMGTFLWMRANTGSKVSSLNIDVEKLVEIGFVKVV